MVTALDVLRAGFVIGLFGGLGLQPLTQQLKPLKPLNAWHAPRRVDVPQRGEILSVLSDEQHVVPPLIEMAADWSPESILPLFGSIGGIINK